MERSPARTPDEDALPHTAARLLPGGVLGSYSAPPELTFVVREGRGARLRDLSGREYVSLAHGDERSAGRSTSSTERSRPRPGPATPTGGATHE